MIERLALIKENGEALDGDVHLGREHAVAQCTQARDPQAIAGPNGRCRQRAEPFVLSKCNGDAGNFGQYGKTRGQVVEPLTAKYGFPDRQAFGATAADAHDLASLNAGQPAQQWLASLLGQSACDAV